MPNAEPSKLHGLSMTELNPALEAVYLVPMPHGLNFLRPGPSMVRLMYISVKQILLCQDRHALKGSLEINPFFSRHHHDGSMNMSGIHYVFINQQYSIKRGPLVFKFACMLMIKKGEGAKFPDIMDLRDTCKV